MALSNARKRANAKYEAKAYDKTLIRLQKGMLDKIRGHAENRDESLNGFIVRAIEETMARDVSESGTGGSTQADAGEVSMPTDGP